MFNRIVVPLDGSVLAESALPSAEDLARLSGAPIHLVRAVDPTSVAKMAGSTVFGTYMALNSYLQSVEDERAAAEDYLETTKANLIARGLTSTAQILRGGCADEIMVNTKLGDLIVMATHGRDGLSRWFLGSVAEDLVRHSNVPVMLIRTGPIAVEPAVDVRAEDCHSPLPAVGAMPETGQASRGVGDVQSRAMRLLHKDHYRPEEAAYLLGIDAQVIYQAAYTHHLTAEIVGHDVVGIRREDLIRWMARGNDNGITRQ